MDSSRAIQCYEHISKLAYDAETHQRPIWKLRLLTEKHYASRLVYLSGNLYRKKILGGIRDVGLSTYLDYHHYLLDGFAMIPVDVTVTTTEWDMKALVNNCIETLYDQNLTMQINLVLEDTVANGAFTSQNLRRWRSSVKIVIHDYGRTHDKGYIYFENESKLRRNRTSCIEKVVVITGAKFRIVTCVWEIVQMSHDFMKTVNNSIQRFPNHFPFWRLGRDEKTIRRFPCYYTPTEAEKRQNRVSYGGQQSNEGTNNYNNNPTPSRSPQPGPSRPDVRNEVNVNGRDGMIDDEVVLLPKNENSYQRRIRLNAKTAKKAILEVSNWNV